MLDDYSDISDRVDLLHEAIEKALKKSREPKAQVTKHEVRKKIELIHEEHARIKEMEII